jgi:hypothetical protein
MPKSLNRFEATAMKIKGMYNGDHDIDPGLAPVTWREMALLDMIEQLAREIEAREATIVRVNVSHAALAGEIISSHVATYHAGEA